MQKCQHLLPVKREGGVINFIYVFSEKVKLSDGYKQDKDLQSLEAEGVLNAYDVAGVNRILWPAYQTTYLHFTALLI